jgi:hypothetical protein
MSTRSGKLQLRMAPEVHAALARVSVQQGTSVNQLINYYIREGLESESNGGEQCIRMLDSLPHIRAKVRITRADAYAEE